MLKFALQACAILAFASDVAFAEPRVAPGESGVFNIAGVNNPYMIEGQGETCLVVGPGSQYAGQFSDRLKRAIRFVFVDFRRTWGAAPDADVSSITLQELVDEVEAVRLALNVDRLCLIGHSTPVFVAIEYALQHPEHTSRVIMLGAPAYHDASVEGLLREFWNEDASADRKARYAQNLTHMPNSVLNTLSSFDDFALRYVRSGPYYFYDYTYDFSWAFIGRYFNAPLAIQFYRTTMANYDPRNRLGVNRVPIFSAVGRYDYIMPPALWDGFSERVPHSTVVMFNRSGHFPHLEEQTRFDNALLRWMARTS